MKQLQKMQNRAKFRASHTMRLIVTLFSSTLYHMMQYIFSILYCLVHTHQIL